MQSRQPGSSPSSFAAAAAAADARATRKPQEATALASPEAFDATHAESSPGGGEQFPPPGTQIGKYELIRELGRGGPAPAPSVADQ